MAAPVDVNAPDHNALCCRSPARPGNPESVKPKRFWGSRSWAEKSRKAKHRKTRKRESALTGFLTMPILFPSRVQHPSG